MQSSIVEPDGGQIALINPKTPWAYVPCHCNVQKEKSESWSLCSAFCRCFSHGDDRDTQTDLYAHFTNGETAVALSQALLCIDNPQIPRGQVSYPISEEFILANCRCQNVLDQPHVIKSTQMLFLGYDLSALQAIDNHKNLSLNPTQNRSGEDSEDQK
ncbi:uncharacterized protein LOC105693902 [Athalia rosae]|uniref:uncharacterized protein LOC105693902 n=1 Tax=Athalia rosae TaxID=37344 RepID=UPI0020343A42|nr:uncharacterized protein LOC105693902 [Athalia rosae]